MSDDDRDTLAAEYVLGTLSAEEREHAEALRSFDPGFEAAVHQWERRLGELNVMVETVEPPAAVWAGIKGEISATARAQVALPHADAMQSSAAGSAADAAPRQAAPTQDMPAETPPAVPPPAPRNVERSAEAIYLIDRVRRWQRMTVGIGAIAALLAVYIAVWQVAPELVPVPLRPLGSGMTASSHEGERMPQDRLVAVLQQEPTAPAFLLTLDTRHRILIVRRVAAAPESGKSYQLWLISKRLGAPRSLGVVGDDEFTQRPLPHDYDVETLRTASYAVSLEPAGGTQNGPPTGPVLFTGQAVESLPASAPQTPKT